MKNYFFFLFVILFYAGKLMGQAPQRLSYQGIARKPSGEPIENTTITVRLSIRNPSVSPNPVFSETKSISTNPFGLYSITINDGNGTVTGNFSDINWKNGTYFLQTEIDPANGTAFIDAGSTQLLSVPYAIHAAEAFRWKNNDPVIQTGTVGSGLTLPEPGNGPRMIWYPRKGAFMAGINNSSAYHTWNDSNIGEGSISLGYQSTAKGFGSVAIGHMNMAHATGAVAIGSGSSADKIHSIALGPASHANAMYSLAIGDQVVSKTPGGMVIGACNDTLDNPTTPKDTDRLFQIGNGKADNMRSNAMTILRNGNIGVGELLPEHLLHLKTNSHLEGKLQLLVEEVEDDYARIGFANHNGIGWHIAGRTTKDTKGSFLNFYSTQLQENVLILQSDGKVIVPGTLVPSDRRLKKDFVKVEHSLPKILKLQAYEYGWLNPKKGDERETGLIAQELEEVFPELVKTGEKDYKAVNYTGLVPHLLEAIKELKAEIDHIRNENRLTVADLETKLSSLQPAPDTTQNTGK